MARKKITHTNKEATIFSIVTYVFFIAGLIWFLLDEDMKKHTFTKFHFKQSLVLFVVYLGATVVANGIPFLNTVLLPLVSVACVVLIVLGIINASNGEKKELPVIGQLAKFLDF